MNAKQIGGGVVWLAALACLVGSMCVNDWYYESDTNDDGAGGTTTFTFQAGLKRYKKTVSDGDNSVSDSGALSALESDPDLGPLAKALNQGGTYVVATGVPAAVCVVAGLVLYVLYCRRTLGGLAIFGAVTSLLAGAVLTTVGMLLYAHELHIGYAYVLYLAAALALLVATVTMVLAVFGDTGAASSGKTKPLAVLVACAGALALIVASLVLLEWFVVDTGSGMSVHIGVKRYKVVSDDHGEVQSGPLSDLTAQSDQFQRFVDGGNFVLGFGVVAAVCALAGAVATGFVAAGKDGAAVAVAVVCNFLGLALLVVGTCLYAKKMAIGYSFVVFVCSSALTLVATALLVAGVMVESSTGLGTAYKLDTETSASHHQRLADDGGFAGTGGRDKTSAY